MEGSKESGAEQTKDDLIVEFLGERVDLDRIAEAGEGTTTELFTLDLTALSQEPVMQEWMSELQAEVDSVYETQGDNPEALVQAQLSMDIRRATVYYRAGIKPIALETLRESLDAAQSVVMSDSGVAELAASLLARMEAGETIE